MNLRLLASTVLLAAALPLCAQSDDAAAAPKDTPKPGPAAAPANTPKQPAKPDTLGEALPADKSVPQTITVNGKTIHYTATVGKIQLKARDV